MSTDATAWADLLSAAVGPAEAAHLAAQFVRAFDACLAADLRDLAEPPESVLVAWGYPLEFSLRLQQARDPSWRVAFEPLCQYSIEERQSRLPSRLDAVLHGLDLVEHAEFLRRMLYDLVRPGEMWIAHTAVVLRDRPGLQLYLAPVRCGGVCETEFTMRVKERVEHVMAICGLEEQVSVFRQAYAAMSEPGDPVGERLITFIGIDFEHDRRPAVKVYFNPQSQGMLQQ